MSFHPLRQLNSRAIRSITSKGPSKSFFRGNATVTTPKQTTAPAIVATPPPPPSSSIRGTRKPIGGFRGGITGFLLGTSVAAAYGYYYLLTTLSDQSTVLNGAITDLQASTNALQSYISKVDALEKDFLKLENRVSSKEDLEGVRAEFKRVALGIREEGLELKERLVGLESDVAVLTRNARTQLQPQ